MKFSHTTPPNGFTLIELLLVISILSLLTTIVLASLNTSRAKARDAKLVAETKQLQKALDLYFSDHNEYTPHTPINEASGEALEKYTSIDGDTTEAVFRTAIQPYMLRLPNPGNIVDTDKKGGGITHAKMLYRRLINNTVPGCSNINNNCYAIVVWSETNTAWSNANEETYFLSNGEIRHGYDATLF